MTTNSSIESISRLIRSRRSVFPQFYTDQPIEKETLEEILENATWAPNHKKTEPWRFIVFYSEDARKKLSQFFEDHYKKQTPPENYSELQQKKAGEKPLQAGAVVAIIMQHHVDNIVPEWEEIAAVACGVQNMWLTCTAKNIGSYWASPGSILKANEFLELESNEKCLGLLYMGYHEAPDLPAKRMTIEEKTKWM